jgi:4-alpha-glucanotransferase
VGPSAPKHRRAGVILHPTSLPGPYGCGEIGAEALRFVDWLADAGMQLWQLLPLVPPENEFWSPYSGLDALCGNTLLLPLDELVAMGLLAAADLPPRQPCAPNADFAAVHAAKTPLLEKAAAALLGEPRFAGLRDQMGAFRAENPWLEESALFAAIAEMPGLEGVVSRRPPPPLRACVGVGCFGAHA